jgi:hypothetical protein
MKTRMNPKCIFLSEISLSEKDYMILTIGHVRESKIMKTILKEKGFRGVGGRIDK